MNHPDKTLYLDVSSSRETTIQIVATPTALRSFAVNLSEAINGLSESDAMPQSLRFKYETAALDGSGHEIYLDVRAVRVEDLPVEATSSRSSDVIAFVIISFAIILWIIGLIASVRWIFF
jgi:hypothetical protein